MLRYLLLTLIFNVSLVSASFAENTIDLFSGTISTGSTSVYAENCEGFICFWESTTRNVSFENDSYPGIRATFWSEQKPYAGGAIELSSYSLSDNQSIDIDIVSLSFQGLLRGNFFASDKIPNGRLQPYIGLGLFFISADVSVNFAPDISSTFDVNGDDKTVGFLYGVRFQVTEKISVFIERRDLNFNANFGTDDSDFVFFQMANVSMKLDSTINLVGLSWKF